MLRNYLFLLGVLCAGLMHNASAQLVFVPDINFRAALNNRVPGVVDANGYIDTQSFAVQTAVVIGNAEGVNPLVIDWTPADLTGLEGLAALYSLAIAGETGLLPTVTLPTLPSSLHHLHLSALSIASLPILPTQLETLAMLDLVGTATVSALPTGLDALKVIGLAQFATIPNWPTNTTTIELAGLAAMTQLPAFTPADFGQVIDLRDMPLSELPDWPQGLEDLTLINLPDITVIPPPPPTLVSLELDCENLLCLPPLPNGLLDLTTNLFPSWQCLPNIPANLQLVMGGFPVGVDSSALCTIINSACPPGAPVVLGRVFVDSNGNGQYNTGEPPYPQASVTAANAVTAVGNNGIYDLTVGLGPHTLICLPNSPYVSGVVPAAHTASFANVAEVDSLNDFAVTLQSNIQDLVVDVTMLTPPVPGFYNQARISYLNAGTQLQNGSVTFTHDALATFASSTPAPDLVNVNTRTWNFTQLQIGEQRAIDVMLYTPIGTPLGTLVSHVATADPLPSDEAPINNTDTTGTDVVGSYDPNDKSVSPTALTPAQVAAEERLTYIIRFQNTGTWPATRVVLTDTLSTDLQWNTMQEIAASHAHTWHIADGVLHVVFDNIMLPDSNANEPGSHGFFKFSMKPVSTLILGDAVSNVANIYFDFNEPVITNAAVFTVDNNVAVAEVPHNGLHLSPNPTSDVLTVLLDEPADRAAVQVMDVTGRAVLSTTLSGTRLLLDVQTLRPGSYTVRVGDGMVGRFVKK